MFKIRIKNRNWAEKAVSRGKPEGISTEFNKGVDQGKVSEMCPLISAE